MPGRYWGIWTREKLDILRRYLDAFTTASKSSREIVYLDLFAGQTENYQRDTLDRLEGSALIAMQTANPPFSRCAFFELPHHAAALEARLRADFPGRTLAVYPGDCNATIHQALADLRPFDWAPTFAFIDPNGPHVHWSTLAALAGHRRGDYKVELWLLFPVHLFVRILPVDGSPVTEANGEMLTAMFGTEHWKAIYRARLDEILTPGQATSEYVNLMRWRLENDLGYRWTHPLEVINEANRPLYTMIFATDHDAGTRIMTWIYTAHAGEFANMREATRRRRQEEEELAATGMQFLFAQEEMDDLRAPVRGKERFYFHEQPWLPYDMPDPATMDPAWHPQ